MAGDSFTREQENRVIDILIELYARGRFVTYADLAAAIGFDGSRHRLVACLIASARICHDHSSRIVTRDGAQGALAQARVGSEQGIFHPAAHLRLDEAAIAVSQIVPGELIESDLAVLRGYCRT